MENTTKLLEDFIKNTIKENINPKSSDDILYEKILLEIYNNQELLEEISFKGIRDLFLKSTNTTLEKILLIGIVTGLGLVSKDLIKSQLSGNAEKAAATIVSQQTAQNQNPSLKYINPDKVKRMLNTLKDDPRDEEAVEFFGKALGLDKRQIENMTSDNPVVSLLSALVQNSDRSGKGPIASADVINNNNMPFIFYDQETLDKYLSDPIGFFRETQNKIRTVENQFFNLPEDINLNEFVNNPQKYSKQQQRDVSSIFKNLLKLTEQYFALKTDNLFSNDPGITEEFNNFDNEYKALINFAADELGVNPQTFKNGMQFNSNQSRFCVDAINDIYIDLI